MITNQWIRRIEQRFWPEGFRRNIWMIVDAARDRRILPILRELHLEYYCLYAGSLTPSLASAAPYLLQLEYDDKDAHRFLTQAWGKNWGVFLKCGIFGNTLTSHLRGFLMVRDAEGNRLVFRYYDPRVLRVYLPTCLAEELKIVFGPIECFWIEDRNSPENMLEFRLDKANLVQTTFSLALDATLPGVRSNTPASGKPMATNAFRDREILTIRKEQMAVFVESETKKFEDRMVVHLRKLFSRKYEALGERGTRQMIQQGIKQAASYNIRAERDVCKYIDLMFVFGSHFDTDLKLSWPRPILNDPRLKNSTVKIDRLFEAAKQNMQRGGDGGGRA
jgi:hypothetical protein